MLVLALLVAYWAAVSSDCSMPASYSLINECAASASPGVFRGETPLAQFQRAEFGVLQVEHRGTPSRLFLSPRERGELLPVWPEVQP
jgi:hypothetical protein